MRSPNRLLLIFALVGALAAAGCAANVPAPAGLVPPARLDSVAAARQMDVLRSRIDSVDAALARLVAERLSVARAIGDVKRAAGRPVVDTTREAVVVERFVGRAAAYGVPEDVAAGLIRQLILAARAQQ